MKVVPLYCPNCGAPLGKDARFCSQCGSPIVIDDEVKRSEHVYREIDEARLREAEAAELIHLKELEIQLEKEKQITFRKKAKYVVIAIAILAFFIYAAYCKYNFWNH